MVSCLGLGCFGGAMMTRPNDVKPLYEEMREICRPRSKSMVKEIEE